MLTHDEMIGLQSEKHDLIDAENFHSKEDYVLHLIHTFAYVKAASLAENKSVLDLGCNTGYGTEILSKSAKRVVGVDVSKEAILLAKNQYSVRGIDFQLIDGKQLPFADNEFDVIVSCQVIEHIVDHDMYIGEIKRVLSPRGLVFFTTPNSLLRLDPGMKPWNKFHVLEFDHSTLEALLKKYFSVARITGLFAEESIYSIEFNRLRRAREHARKAQQRDTISTSTRKLVKKILPNFILNIVRPQPNPTEPASHKAEKLFLNKYGLNDFFYKSDDLENALDLMAICNDDEIT